MKGQDWPPVTLEWCPGCHRWTEDPAHPCTPPQPTEQEHNMTTQPDTTPTWEVSWQYADPDEPGHDLFHTRTVLAGPPNVTSENSTDAVPEPLTTWARQIGQTYTNLVAITYAITDLLDLTDPPRDHYGAVMPGYQSTSTIHEDVYTS